MKICRYNDDRIGVVAGDEVVDVTAAAEALPAYRWPLPHGDAFMERLEALLPAMRSLAQSGRRQPLAAVSLLSPVANPGKIIGIGRSYRGHAEEAAKDPAMSMHKAETAPDTIRMFIKANTALVGPSQGVALRFTERRNDPELELSIVIGRRGTEIPRSRCLDHVAGYAIGLDMTLRGPEPPSSRKSIDSYAVLGPWLVTADELRDPDAVEMRLSVNGELRQRANTRDLLFSIGAIIENAAKFYTLYPGDIIMTGTPEGVAAVHPGDRMLVEAQGIGAMQVEVRAQGAGRNR